MRSLGLRALLALMGIALIAGTVIHFLPAHTVPSTLSPLDRYVGTEGSVVGAIFGIGLLYVAGNPYQHRLWLNLALAYSVLLVLGQVVGRLSLGRDLELAPIVWGIFTGALLLALRSPANRGSTVRPATTTTEAGDN